MAKNFLPEQYAFDNQLQITHNHLQHQFDDCDVIFQKMKEVVKRGDFTLGKSVDAFENAFKNCTQTKYAISVNSGTDALFLSLKLFNIQPGDEVITTPFTFFATTGAIVAAGAKPVFVDIQEDHNINANLISNAITSKTKVILPVHWSGKICDMRTIDQLAKKNHLHVIEDACHAVMAEYHGKRAGSLGDFGCFSFHPLKNLNVWGDGGMIVTNSDAYAEKLLTLRNHGLVNREQCVKFGYNSRLDSIQAVVGLHMLEKLDFITNARIQHAAYLDAELRNVSEITIPTRDPEIKAVYHLYSILCKNRDELKQFLIEKGIDAKVHYPVPIHLQPAAAYLGYQKGDFPIAEHVAAHTLSLPVHEFITENDLNFIIAAIKEFYAK